MPNEPSNRPAGGSEECPVSVLSPTKSCCTESVAAASRPEYPPPPSARMRPFQPIIGIAAHMFTCGATRTLTRQYGLSTWLASVGVTAPVLAALTSRIVTAASATSLVAPIPAIVQDATGEIEDIAG